MASSRMVRFNWLLFLPMVALVAIGTVAIHSAGAAREAVFHGMWLANLKTALFGFAVYFALAFTDYRRLLGWFSAPAYAAALAMLVAVLLVGDSVYGGRRWLWFFQPSEVAKLCVIAFMAQLFGRRGSDGRGLLGFPGMLLAAAVVGIPCALILMEPDLGTALTLVPAAIVILLAAGVWRKGLVATLAVGAVAAVALLGAVYEAEKPGCPPERRERIMRCVPLKPHQVKRVKSFLFPEADQLGAGYNGRQAKIAIGSGGFSGKGIGKAEANHLKYLPPSVSMNDFIFCVYAEETGFMGSLVLLALFGTLCVSGTWTAWVSSDGRGRLLALGFSTLVFAHVYVNIAMSIGLVPITGLPLPFISSGRTFLVVVMAGLGLMQSVSIHREEITE